MRFFALMLALSTTSAVAETTFHFYGAEDCPPCMLFKRNYLPTVQSNGDTVGFEVAENVISRTADVPTLGIFGDTDAVLRAALEAGDLIPYPPIFFLTKDDVVLSVHGANWSDALNRAVSEVSE